MLIAARHRCARPQPRAKRRPFATRARPFTEFGSATCHSEPSGIRICPPCRRPSQLHLHLSMNLALRAAIIAALSFLIVAGVAPAPALADSDDTALTNLVALASQRLALAEPVARWKWANHKPITDAPREAELLADVARRAPAAGVDPAYARAFFQDQIDASKQVQTALFDGWQATRPPEGAPPDLATSTRPQLNRLTQSMLQVLARVQNMRDAPDCPARVARSIANWKALTRYGATGASALTTALGHVCTAGGVGAVG
jgi:chorismate mutase